MNQLTPEDNHKNHLKNIEKIKSLESLTHKLHDKLDNYRQTAFHKFPFLFVALSTFGLTATIYGAEKIIDKSVFFSDKPEILLCSGVAVLLLTGTLYKKLN
jgi:hypothetical protein